MSHTLGRRWHLLRKSLQGYAPVLSVPKAASLTSDISSSFLHPESNPANHTLKDVGLLYKVENELSLNSLFKEARLSASFVEESKTFNGTYFMIRKPVLEVINYLKHANYDYPVNKYVLYGKHGHGVSTTLCQIVHYAYLSDWLVVHVPRLKTWVTIKTERIQSATKEGLLDLPLMGCDWLTHFKNQNLNIIKKLDLRLQNDYSWNIQEENKKGESLLNLIDHGITRGKYSCDVVMAVLDEVKLLSKMGKVKTLVAIDNYSVVFQPRRRSTNKNYRNIAAKELSFTNSFKNMAKADWHNGAVVVSCHSEREIKSDIDHFPMNKLLREGFEFLDPFVPVEVPRLTDVEMSKLLDFYRHNKWLLTSKGDKEIKVLSAGNIATLKALCGPL